MTPTKHPSPVQIFSVKIKRRFSQCICWLTCAFPLIPLALNATSLDGEIDKPTGIYSSSVSKGEALSNDHALGALIRVKWNQLEPSPGEYDWSLIEEQINNIDNFSERKFWSLAIIAGKESPEWLYYEADFFMVNSMQGEIAIPKFWDPQVQVRLQELALALADQYGDDPRLSLVYLPQMTSNGVEGHFNGVPFSTLEAAGLNPENWIDSVTTAATAFSLALPNKAIAVEVHTILDQSFIAETIINQLWNDPDLEQRVGAAIWWLSGKQSYQGELLDILRDYPGDIYAQVIGRSDQLDRFQNGDYATVFTQAKELGIRYIEPWEKELTQHTHDPLLADFNQWSLNNFGQASNPAPETASLSGYQAQRNDSRLKSKRPPGQL